MHTVMAAESTSAMGWAYKIPFSPQAIGRSRITGIKQIPCLYLEENIALKEHAPDIPATGMAVLHQQFLLVQAIGEWIATLKMEFP